jgi:hypothetical protein
MNSQSIQYLVRTLHVESILREMLFWEDPIVYGEREDFPTRSSKDIQGLMIVSTSFSEFTPVTFGAGRSSPPSHPANYDP